MGKRLAKIELDPDRRLVDIDRSNDIWTPTAAGGEARRD